MFDKIYSLETLRQLEQKAEKLGVDLMQRAAKSSANWIAKHCLPTTHILVAAGSGNNGGDALWAGFFLAKRGYSITLFLPQTLRSELTIAAHKACQSLHLPEITQLNQLKNPASFLIDGLFGIGLNRVLSEEWQALINQLNNLNLPTLALDVPSGLDAYRGVVYGAAIRASASLTFLCAKPGLYTADGRDYSGEIFVDALDFPNKTDDIKIETQGALNRPNAQWLSRKNNTHKGSFGSVCVVGGAKGMLGAALLSGKAAFASGAGKVFVANLSNLSVDVSTPELMLCDLKNTEIPDADVYVIGPGLSKSEAALSLLEKLLSCTQAKVIDADALNLIATQTKLKQALFGTNSILTPHPAEGARLLKISTNQLQNDRVGAAQQLAKDFGCVVILKGCGSIIARPDAYYQVNTSGGAALAVAGQGDILSGICGGLLAQGVDAFSAATLAVHAHGLAGDSYVAEQGGTIGLTASATLPRVSQVLNKLAAQNQKNLRFSSCGN